MVGAQVGSTCPRDPGQEGCQGSLVQKAGLNQPEGRSRRCSGQRPSVGDDADWGAGRAAGRGRQAADGAAMWARRQGAGRPPPCPRRAGGFRGRGGAARRGGWVGLELGHLCGSWVGAGGSLGLGWLEGRVVWEDKMGLVSSPLGQWPSRFRPHC